jgi:hypothetical protein
VPNISDWLVIMIGLGGLLLVVPLYVQFSYSFIGGVKKELNRHLILLSRVTY